MSALRKPAKRLSEKLNKRRHLRATVKLNSGKVVPKTIINPGGVEETLIYATKGEQSGLKKRGGKGKRLADGIKSFYMEGNPNKSGIKSTSNSGSGTSTNWGGAPKSTSKSSTSGPSASSEGHGPTASHSPPSGPSAGSEGHGPPSRDIGGNLGGQGLRDAIDRAAASQNRAADMQADRVQSRDPTQREAQAEGVRSFAEKARQGISTPMASGSPLNNPTPLGAKSTAAGLIDKLTQLRASQPVEDLTRAEYNRVMGIQSLSKPNLGLPSSYGHVPDNVGAPSVANQLANQEDFRAPPASSDIMAGQVEDLRGPNPSVQEGQIPGFGPEGIRTSFDANLDFLASRGTDLDITGMNPDFTRSLGEALRAAELATGEEAQITELHRDPAIQAQYYANYKGKDVTWDGVTYKPQGKKGGLAAPPGMSRHQLGAAVDIARSDVRDWMQKNASQFGIGQLKAPLARVDPVHFQQIGARPSPVGTTVASRTPPAPASTPTKPTTGVPALGLSGVIAQLALSQIPKLAGYRVPNLGITGILKSKVGTPSAPQIKGLGLGDSITGKLGLATGKGPAMVSAAVKQAVKNVGVQTANFVTPKRTSPPAAVTKQAVVTAPKAVVAVPKVATKLAEVIKAPQKLATVIKKSAPVQAIKTVLATPKALVDKLNPVKAIKADMDRLAAMSPTERATEIARRQANISNIAEGRATGESGINKKEKKLKDAVEAIVVAAISSKYTSEGYLA